MAEVHGIRWGFYNRLLIRWMDGWIISTFTFFGMKFFMCLCVCAHAQYHPDRLQCEDSSEAESGIKKFLEADAAWRILSDQNTRRQYDLQRRGRT